MARKSSDKSSDHVDHVDQRINPPPVPTPPPHQGTKPAPQALNNLPPLNAQRDAHPADKNGDLRHPWAHQKCVHYLTGRLVDYLTTPYPESFEFTIPSGSKVHGMTSNERAEYVREHILERDNEYLDGLEAERERVVKEFAMRNLVKQRPDGSYYFFRNDGGHHPPVSEYYHPLVQPVEHALQGTATPSVSQPHVANAEDNYNNRDRTRPQKHGSSWSTAADDGRDDNHSDLGWMPAHSDDWIPPRKAKKAEKVAKHVSFTPSPGLQTDISGKTRPSSGFKGLKQEDGQKIPVAGTFAEIAAGASASQKKNAGRKRARRAIKDNDVVQSFLNGLTSLNKLSKKDRKFCIERAQMALQQLEESSDSADSSSSVKGDAQPQSGQNGFEYQAFEMGRREMRAAYHSREELAQEGDQEDINALQDSAIPSGTTSYSTGDLDIDLALDGINIEELEF